MKGLQDNPRFAGSVTYTNQNLGAYLKIARQRIGFSLRRLERASGVSDSEIFQIEAGSQKCTLESFVRICSALGVPCGYVLDNVVKVEVDPYFTSMRSGPLWAQVEDVVRDLAKEVADETFIKQVALNLSMMAAFAAHLIRCSRPSARAKEMGYPDDKIKAAFLRFTDWIESDPSPLERLSVLSALVLDPLQEMHRLRLLEEGTVKSFVDMINRGEKKGYLGARYEKLAGVELSKPLWTPFIPTETFERSLFKPKSTTKV
jgi:transcriptional regulator with XRE-family HTH domain